MARKPRIEFPGAVYHVMARANGAGDAFTTDDDRLDFLRVLGETVERCGWVVFAYCLMTNHYHLLVETPEPNLGKGMQLLSGTYTTRFNRRNNLRGHVFQGRYKAVLVEKESHLLEACRYIALNPVRAGMVESAGNYPWSSHRALAGMVKRPKWLAAREVWSRFHRKVKDAQGAYGLFVEGGDPEKSPFDKMKWGLAVGGEEYLARVGAFIEEGAERDQSAVAPKERPSLEQESGGQAFTFSVYAQVVLE